MTTDMAGWLRVDVAEIDALIAQIDARQVEALAEAILAAQRIFVTGQGRSGWIMRMAAIRLMQVGLIAYVAGDATTPPIRSGDLLVIASGSGETPAPLNHARRAAATGARVALITANPASAIGSLADVVARIPGETTKLDLAGTSRLPLAAALEQTTLIVMDALVAWIAERRGETQATMMARHANLE